MEISHWLNSLITGTLALFASIDTAESLTGLMGFSLAGLVGWLIGHSRGQRDITRLREANVRLNTLLGYERTACEEKTHTLDEVRAQFEATFKSLAGDVLKSNSSEFLKLAETSFKVLHTQASGDL